MIFPAKSIIDVKNDLSIKGKRKLSKDENAFSKKCPQKSSAVAGMSERSREDFSTCQRTSKLVVANKVRKKRVVAGYNVCEREYVTFSFQICFQIKTAYFFRAVLLVPRTDLRFFF
jgi:hypothetical protein